MPIYEYRCAQCQSTTDVLQLRLDAAPPKCKSCGSAEMERLISRTSFQLKGSGWYTTDYSKPAPTNPANPASAKPPEKAADSPAENASGKASEKAPERPAASPAPGASACGGGQCANCTPSA